MNIIVITMVHRPMAMVGVLVIAQKTLVIRTITLVMVPRVLFVAVIGTTVRRAFVLRTATAAARRIGTTASVLVFPDRSPDPLNS